MSLRRRSLVTLILPILCVASASVLAACGGAGGGGSGSASDPPASTEPAGDASATGRPSAAPPLAPAVDPAIVSTLRTAGFELGSLPDLATLHEPGHPRMRAIMKAFTLALGTTCDGCHLAGAVTDDEFRADAPRKNIAGAMYARVVQALEKRDGSPILCDTCHQGKLRFLDRSDDDALRAWMQGQLVDGLARQDGKANSCATCHGDPFRGPILDEWSK